MVKFYANFHFTTGKRGCPHNLGISKDWKSKSQVFQHQEKGAEYLNIWVKRVKKNFQDFKIVLQGKDDEIVPVANSNLPMSIFRSIKDFSGYYFTPFVLKTTNILKCITAFFLSRCKPFALVIFLIILLSCGIGLKKYTFPRILKTKNKLWFLV